MTSTLIYTMPTEQFDGRVAEIYSYYNSFDAEIAAYFFDTLDQHHLIVGVDFDAVSQSAYGTSIDSSGHREIIEYKRITLTFNDDAKAMLFKLSHDGGAA